MLSIRKILLCGVPLVPLLLVGLCASVDAAGLAVSPGGLMIQDVPLGEVVDVHAVSRTGLTIYNRDNAPHTYTLSAHKPSMVGNRRWEKGYLEIPDPGWCRFDKEEVTIQANGRAFVKIYIEIPDKETYRNQHWVVALGVLGKSGPGAGFALGVYVRMQIETAVSEAPGPSPDGALAFKPATVILATGEQARKRIVTIYNNTSEPRNYTVSSLFKQDKTEYRTYLSASCKAMPGTVAWPRAKREIRIAPFSCQPLPLWLDLSKSRVPEGGRGEDVLLLTPDQGLPGFVRVRIEMK